MTERTNVSRVHHIGRVILAALVILVACMIALQWSWNAIASELFAMPSMQFRHALGFEVLMGVVFVIAGAAVRLFLGRPERLMKGGAL